MSFQLITVTATLADPSGAALEGVRIIAELTAPMIPTAGLIVPVREEQLTDRDGNATLKLVPNGLDGSQTTYTFTLEHSSIIPTLVFYDVVVSDSPLQTTLQELLGRYSHYMGSGVYMVSGLYMR